MSISKLPSGRYRVQVYDPSVGRKVSAAQLLGQPAGSYRLLSEARVAERRALEQITGPRSAVTVGEFRELWLAAPVFQTPKRSSMIRRAEATKQFAAEHGSMPLAAVGDLVVARWLQGGPSRPGTVPGLRAMWNAAGSAEGGRLVARNPWAGLGLERSRGNRDTPVPAPEMIARLIAVAATKSPGLAAWLAVGAHVGMRPGELDALRWQDVDRETQTIRVCRQFSAATRTFTLPKNGRERDAPLTAPAATAISRLPCESEFVFVSARGHHFTASTRAYHWNAVRTAAEYTGTIYMAGRHYAGWYMTNVLELPSEDVAIALGHTDGGDLVRRLYGHRDRRLALDRVRSAYAQAGQVQSLPAARRLHTA